MTQTVRQYAAMLAAAGATEGIVRQSMDILDALPQLRAELADPAAPLEGRHHVIDKVFPKEVRGVFKLLCDEEQFEAVSDIADAFYAQQGEKHGALPVTITYVTAPDEAQIARFREYLSQKYPGRELELTLREDKSLLGGFILRAGSAPCFSPCWAASARCEIISRARETASAARRRSSRSSARRSSSPNLTAASMRSAPSSALATAS